MLNHGSHGDKVEVRCYTSGNLYYSKILDMDKGEELANSIALTGDCISIDSH